MKANQNESQTLEKLSYGQRSQWFFYRLATDSGGYNINYFWKIKASIDIPSLISALTRIADRHPILRITFFENDGIPFQVVNKNLDITINEIDGSEWDDNDLKNYINKETFKPFDLENESSFRWSIIKQKNDEFIFSMTTHHITMDLWSYMIFVNELKQFYIGAKYKKEVNLPPVKKQYSDFVEWQSQYINNKQSEKDWQYWEKKLRGELPNLELPLDYPKSPKLSFKSGFLISLIKDDLLNSLKKLAEKEGVSLYLLFMTIYQVFLHRYSGQKDILIGTPVAGRKRKDFAGILGYFVNIIVIRTNLSSNPSFRECLRQTVNEVKSAREHQDFPFSLLVDRLQPKRKSNQSPIIQSTYSWEDSNRFENKNNPLITCDEHGNEIWDLEDLSMELINKQTVNEHHFSLRIAAFENCLRVHFDYNTEAIKKSSIKRMISSFYFLIESILENPDVPIGNLNILTETEKNIISKWNNTQTDYPQDMCVYQIFESHVIKRPNAIALVQDDEQLTYQQLNRKANQLANYLKKFNIEPGTKVAICTERSIATIIGLLAIQKVGGVYVPIDSTYPDERIAFMVKDTSTPLILTFANKKKRFSKFGTQIICFDDDWEDIKKESFDNLPNCITTGDLIYVIYTSGSTGKPKGVCVNHRGVLRLVKNTNYMQFTANDTFLQFSSISFDASTFEIWGSLLNGSKLVLFPNYFPSIEELGRFIQENAISTMFVTTALFHKIVDGHLYRFNSLKNLLFGGEVISAQHVKKAKKELKKVNLIICYGPTENTTYTCCFTLKNINQIKNSVPIGFPISNTQVHILNEYLQPVPIGVIGELCITGDGLAEGYLNRPELTKEKFIKNPFSNDPNKKLYKTGDLVRYLSDDNIEFVGRVDNQVKIRGFRIEPEEIEVQLSNYSKLKDAIVQVVTNDQKEKQLVAYVVADIQSSITVSDLKAYLDKKLPKYMIPSAFFILDEFPLKQNGKIDRERLPKPVLIRPNMESEFVAAETTIEELLVLIWKKVLNIHDIGIHDNFFDLGGNSILMLQVFSKLPENIQDEVKMVDLFEHPTVHTLSQFLEQKSSIQPDQSPHILKNDHQAQKISPKSTVETEIAIIGMAGRFPGANSPEELWNNLCNEVESISRFTKEELYTAGIREEDFNNPNYVKARAVIKNADLFDSKFFDFSPREANMTNPQHRLFLECSWEALENAGYTPDQYQKRIGVYGGSGSNSYISEMLIQEDAANTASDFPLMIGNEKDFLCTRVSYKLNLKGPAVVVQSACSTSLTAVHTACRDLRNNDCDMALAGGASIIGLDKEGYLYQPGGILSPDGHCRPFDSQAKGTVPGQGVGIVVLKKLSDAEKDGDTILAVIKGSAINNDGALKVGYTAPGIEGQVSVIRSALHDAQINPASVSYIETHGTGTPIGDPIEIRALTKAYGTKPKRKTPCSLGATKSNIGHLDAAAGVTGLIKTVLAIKHRKIPPVLHYKEPNADIDFASGLFQVNTSLTEWSSDDGPLRAGISSFGIGGTNAHVILESPAETNPSEDSDDWYLLPFSAKSEAALKKTINNFIELLKKSSKPPNFSLANAAYTLQVGRKEFDHRCIITCKNCEDAVEIIEFKKPEKMIMSQTTSENRPVVFMFPGQGSQYINMGKELYENEPVFRQKIDNCFDIYADRTGIDLREVVYPDPIKHDRMSAERKIYETQYTQPILFIFEYALAKLWMNWGIVPQSMIGHSIGEYVAACLSGVFSVEDGLFLVSERGNLIQELPFGDMLSVRMSKEEVQPLLNDRLSLAAVNTPKRCVISGETAAIKNLTHQLDEMNKDYRLLYTSHAFHSHMLEPILDDFRQVVSKIQLNNPKIPFSSNVTGEWVDKKHVTDPEYWIHHLRGTTLFSQGIRQILKKPEVALLEVGPGRVLRTLSSQNLSKKRDHLVASSIKHSGSHQSDKEFILFNLGKLWSQGVKIDWNKFNDNINRKRISLPTYPFERRRHWVEVMAKPRASSDKIPNVGDWFYLPTWKQSYHPSRFIDKIQLLSRMNWLVFVDEKGLGKELVEMLETMDQNILTVKQGEEFKQIDEQTFQINNRNPEDYHMLVEALLASDNIPQRIIHLWSVLEEQELTYEFVSRVQCSGFISIIYLVQAFNKHDISELMQIQLVSNNIHEVLGNESLSPSKATLLALVNGLHQELPHISCQSVDILLDDLNDKNLKSLVNRLIKEIDSPSFDRIIAYRQDLRWIQVYEKRYWEPLSKHAIHVAYKGVYLITGGLGNIGLIIAEYLARSFKAKLVLLGRSEFPVREEWDQWLDQNGSDGPISKKIFKIKELERLGADVLVIQADVADLQQMEKAIKKTVWRYRKIDGVFHAAGDIGAHTLQKVNKITPELCERQFRPKIYGLFVLENVLQELSPSFIMLFSSLSAVTGGIEYMAYAAANLFMDSFGRFLNKYSTFPWITLNWDGWKTDKTQQLDFLITPEEGVDVINRVLSLNLTPQLIISTIDLFNRLERQKAREAKMRPESLQSESRQMVAPISDDDVYITPQNETEQKVYGIWKQFLGIDRISTHEDFFDLGGDSLMAIRLTAKLNELFPGVVTEKCILEESTIANLSKFIDSNLAEKSVSTRKKKLDYYQSMIKIQEGDSNYTPLFLVHTGIGFVYIYMDMAKNLGKHRPVYAFQARGIKPGTLKLHSIEEMAASYIRELIDFQPNGPYLLGGASAGGFIAYEMSLQLKAYGYQVPLLTMLDTPGPAKAMPKKVSNKAEMIRRMFWDRLDMNDPALNDIPPEKLVDHIVEVLNKKGESEGLSAEFINTCMEVAKSIQEAMFKYKPEQYPGEILFFRHTESLDDFADFPERPWIDLAEEGVRVIKAPGNHNTMNLNPHVVPTADKIELEIKKIEKRMMITKLQIPPQLN